ncbi:sensor histidine kinase [Streptomyces sp. NPDC001635]
MALSAVKAMHTVVNPRSLRWKIAALAAAASCAVALAIGVLVHERTYEQSMATGQAMALYRLGTAPPPDGPADDGFFRDSELLPDSLVSKVRAAEGPQTWYDNRRPTVPWMWAATESHGQWTGVRVDMTFDMLSRKALDRHILYAAVAALATVIPLTALTAELLNRRLRKVAATARCIADGDLDARIGGTPRDGDEIAGISTAVDQMAGTLQRRLRDEQRFTADVAHELRTPLMGLVTAAALLPEGEATELVRNRAQVLRALVEDLLEISRLDAGAERAELFPVPLGPVVEEAVARTGLAAQVTITNDATVETDPRRLDRILTNLITNAHRHGRPPVTVAVSGTGVVIQDHGVGFPQDLLTHGPQRFRTGTQERGTGHGLGLTIALGHAHVIGARLEFANTPNGGAAATLHLPPALAAGQTTVEIYGAENAA